MKEMLRGALLSVLFFGLMVGGTPTIAAAASDSPTGVESADKSHGGWPYYGGDGHEHPPPPPPDPCEFPVAIEAGGVAVGTLGLLAGGFGGGIAAGAMMTVGGIMAGVGHVMGVVMGC